jgi:hypothetical protein
MSRTHLKAFYSLHKKKITNAFFSLSHRKQCKAIYIFRKHFLYWFQQDLNESTMINGSKVRLSTGHLLILTPDHHSSEAVVLYELVFHYINYVSFYEKLFFICELHLNCPEPHAARESRFGHPCYKASSIN